MNIFTPVDIIFMLLFGLILIGLTAVAIVEAQIKQKLDARLSAPLKDDINWNLLADQVAAIMREQIPSTGATMSFRINETSSNIIKLIENSIKRDAAAEEARNADRIAKDTGMRNAQDLSAIQSKIESIVLTQSLQARDTAKVLNIIQNSGTAGQISAGQGNRMESTE